jgi:hypothetical protein
MRARNYCSSDSGFFCAAGITVAAAGVTVAIAGITVAASGVTVAEAGITVAAPADFFYACTELL